jgi:hypothetical protein
MAAIEDTPNIGKVLGKRLRTVGIDTREKLETMGTRTHSCGSARHFPRTRASILASHSPAQCVASAGTICQRPCRPRSRGGCGDEGNDKVA